MIFIDSHTEGEPTRVIVSEEPYPVGRHRALVCEPRGQEALVGAWLTPSSNGDVSVTFFNNVGVLGMCGHGSIGVAATLAWLSDSPLAGDVGWLVEATRGKSEIRLDTPVGIVEVRVDGRRAWVRNVVSRRLATGVESCGLTGDVAWGGNWFYIAASPIPLEPGRIKELTAFAQEVQDDLNRRGIGGDDGRPIDHIELTGPPTASGAMAKNFVLCPGGEFDRCPCGTGTSAKIACLAADGKLAPGEEWVQEGILGTCFSGRYELASGGVLPTISGRAWVTAWGRLVFSEDDPLAGGLDFG